MSAIMHTAIVSVKVSGTSVGSSLSIMYIVSVALILLFLQPVTEYVRSPMVIGFAPNVPIFEAVFGLIRVRLEGTMQLVHELS